GTRSPTTIAPARLDSVTVTGLGAPVEIVTDRFGVPHVHARTRADLYFAWGFVSARDRLWQLENLRAQVEGRRWRWFGNRVLSEDGGAQLFELSERAERIWERDRADPAVAEALGRYAGGINAYLALCRSGARPWPRELDLVHDHPADWRPSDAYRILFGESFLLDFEVPELAEADSLARHDAAWLDTRHRFENERHWTTIPDSAAARMYASWPRAVATTAAVPDVPAGTTAAATHADATPGTPGHPANPWLAEMAARDPEQRASNVYAVGPARSASHRPLLANDPHLPLTSPGTLHVIHVRCDEDSVDALGAYCPGLPAIVSGRNRRVAWGLTVLSADNIDVYADTLSPDRHSVRYLGRWVPVREGGYTMRYRALGVLDLPPFGQVRRYTPHGPVIRWDTKRGIALSVCWAGRDEDVTLSRLLGLEHSRDALEVTARWRTLVRPTFNIVAADVDGHVRYQTVGAEPRRGFAPIRGILPGDGRHEWLGTIAPDSMPAWDVPASGFVVNGNNLPVGGAYPEPWPRFDWRQDRARRLAQRLAGDTRLTLEDMASVQSDVISLAAAELVPALVAHADSLRGMRAARSRVALDTLRAWRFDARRGRVAPTLYRSWWSTLLAQQGWTDVPGLAAAALEGQAEGAFHDPETGAPVRPAIAVAAALDTALARLDVMLGPDLSTWTWGRAHVARFAHELTRLDPDLEPPLTPEDGDNHTPSVGASSLPRSRVVTHGPVWRQVVDLARPDVTWGIVPPGNSGEGRHARDLLAAWANHQLVPLYLDPAKIRAVSESETRLMPRDASPGR
ncbi:MAG: penicillin acylase family protein, partial [Candidatus Eisenbacteria bacterium]